MVFKITKNSVFKDNPELTVIEELMGLNEAQVKFILLAYDYTGPFRQLGKQACLTKSAIIAGYKDSQGGLSQGGKDLVSGKIESVNKAIKWFLSIQKNETRELVAAYTDQIDEMKLFLKRPKQDEKDWAIALKIVKELPIVIAKRNELEKIMMTTNETVEEVAAKPSDENTNMSTLDKINIRKQEQY